MSNETPEQLRQEIAFLKQQLDVVADGVTEQKYLQQAKKLRDLSVKLDSEKARVAKLQQTIIKYERQQSEISEAERKGVLLPSAAGGGGGGGGGNNNNNSVSAQQLELQYLNNQVSDLKQKLDRVSSQNASLRGQTEKYDKEMARIRKILLIEIGDENTVNKLLNNNNNNNQNDDEQQSQQQQQEGGYRGRAQQISLLQSKVKELTRQIQQQRTATSVAALNDSASVAGGGDAISVIAPTTTVKDFDSAHRSVIAQQESKKSLEVRQLQQSLEESKEHAGKEKQRADALSSRIHVLEKQLQQLKSSLQQVISKTENDNLLIDAYKQELEAQRNEIRQLSNKQQQQQFQNIGSSPAPPTAFATTTSSNTIAVQEHLQKIQQLEKEVSTLQRQLAMIKQHQYQNNNKEQESTTTTTKIDNLDSAVNIVEAQRKMVLSLERKLQEVMNNNSNRKSNPAAGENISLTQALRDENSSLKERISALTSMIDREIELKRMQLEAKYAAKQQQQQLPAVVHVALAPPPAAPINTSNNNNVPIQPRGSAIQEPSTPPRQQLPVSSSSVQQQQQQVPKRSVRPDKVVVVASKQQVPPPPVNVSSISFSNKNVKQNDDSDDDGKDFYDAPPKFTHDDVLDKNHADDDHDHEEGETFKKSKNDLDDEDDDNIDLSVRNNKRNQNNNQQQPQRTASSHELGSSTTIPIGAYARPLSLRGL